ncbi:MAG: hypothetical protein NG747_12340 [Candidatus Brocadia sp.]|nr:hypothetical protein [Candidatus Brocadia sp.]
MRKHDKNDCSRCHEYPRECDACCSDARASMNLKTHCRNKKKDAHKDNNSICNN